MQISLIFQAVVSEVPEIILRCISRDEAAMAVAQKAFKALYDNASSNLHISANLAILVAIRDVCKLVVKELTSWVCLLAFQVFIILRYITLLCALVQLLLIVLHKYATITCHNTYHISTTSNLFPIVEATDKI